MRLEGGWIVGEVKVRCGNVAAETASLTLPTGIELHLRTRVAKQEYRRRLWVALDGATLRGRAIHVAAVHRLAAHL